MTANLMASVQLGDAAGKQAMFEAVVADGAALAGLTLCSSDVHRSFWLYVNHPALFERAYDFSFWEHHGQQTQQYDLGLKRQPNGSDANLAALRHASRRFTSAKCSAATAAWRIWSNAAQACSCSPSTSRTWPCCGWSSKARP